MSQKTLLAPGSIVRWHDHGMFMLGKIKTIDRVFIEGGVTCMSLAVIYDERYRREFPMSPHETYITYPTNCEVVFV